MNAAKLDSGTSKFGNLIYCAWRCVDIHWIRLV